jgi:uncharacterized protein (TIGR02145 family)
MTHLRDLLRLPGTPHLIASLCCTMLILASGGCSDKAPPPVAKLAVYPPVGDTSILFECNAATSTDETFYHIALKYRWDFNGDLIWDTGFSDEPILVKYFSDPGTYPVAVEVINSDGMASIAYDTLSVYGRNRLRSMLTDPRDGQTYRTVSINGRWWMAESLRYGAIVDPWNPGMTNNGIPERVMISDCWFHGNWSVYSWFEAMDYSLSDRQGICPDGWHVPAQKEWESLYAGLPGPFSGKYFGKGGLSGLELQDGLCAQANQVEKHFFCMSDTHYWSSSHDVIDSTGFRAGDLNFYDQAGIHFGYWPRYYLDGSYNKQIMNSVRCIKDTVQ